MSKFQFEVLMRRKIERDLEKLPNNIRFKVASLIDDLTEKGPALPHWSNYSKLSETEYHCHLAYKWVACWRHEKGTITIEV